MGSVVNDFYDLDKGKKVIPKTYFEDSKFSKVTRKFDSFIED